MSFWFWFTGPLQALLWLDGAGLVPGAEFGSVGVWAVKSRFWKTGVVLAGLAVWLLRFGGSRTESAERIWPLQFSAEAVLTPQTPHLLHISLYLSLLVTRHLLYSLAKLPPSMSRGRAGRRTGPDREPSGFYEDAGFFYHVSLQHRHAML